MRWSCVDADLCKLGKGDPEVVIWLAVILMVKMILFKDLLICNKLLFM